MRENIWKNIKLGFKTNKLAVAGGGAHTPLATTSTANLQWQVQQRSSCWH